ncbi:MAG: hypothetical protein IJ637_03705 [Prevotella sp.]|nr:hypothetical protein [Prevotella sp.]
MQRDIYSAASLMDYIREVGFLPLLSSGIPGFSADEVVSDDCRYVVFPDGGWDWPLWRWKGPIVTSGDFVYGKFFAGKAGFISREWWPDFYNYRRSQSQPVAEGSVEEAILFTLQERGSLITRQLRTACGFDGPRMRGKFDSYVSRLQMQCRIVTEDFVYPTDRHGREYGWGWSLLNTPEQLYGREACMCSRTPQESRERLEAHLSRLLPTATAKQIQRLLRV